MILWSILGNTLIITAFVGAMMVAVEYINVLTGGTWQKILSGSPWRQYLLAVLLGATPGCLGAFVMVTLYTHRMVSIGALTACMIATSGDEAFVMLALFPGTAVLLTIGLAVVALVVGFMTDALIRPGEGKTPAHALELHPAETCDCFQRGNILNQLRQPSAARGILTAGMFLFALAIVSGQVGPQEWNWIRITLTAVAAFGLFIVLTVPEHFLEEHLWRHTALQHVPRIFLWTLGALALVELLEHFVHLETAIRQSRWAVLGAAAALGIIPDSGPHLIFVTLYDKGVLPVSTLMASSIVQDGHGMLPLLAWSRAEFLKVKGINLAVGLAVGAVLLLFGW